MCVCCVHAYVVCCEYADSCGLLAFSGIPIYKHVVCAFFFPPLFFFLIIGLLSFHSQVECALNRPDEHPSRLQRPVPGLP